MELVVAVTSRKLASIDVVGQEEFPFEMVLGKQVGAGIKKVSCTSTLQFLWTAHMACKFHESKGVKFHMESKVEKIIPSESDPSVASAVVVTSGSGQSTTLEADVVVMGVGVAPATEYLKNSKGFEKVVDNSGAVHVDEYLKVKGLENVYAIGAYPRHTHPIRRAHDSTAQATSRCILSRVQASLGGSSTGT